MTSIHVRRLQSRVERTTARYLELAERERLSVADLRGTLLPWYAIRNQAAESGEEGGGGFATVFMFDEIGGSLGVSAKQFVAELEEITAPVIRLRINSPGGSVFDAIAIHNALRHHPARVEVYVDSLAASAASVVAVAGDEVIMMPGSQLMIHNASAHEEGDEDDHAKMTTFLARQSENIADLYRLKGGGTVEEWRELMRAETWMFAREAVQLGLADRVAEYGPVSSDADLEERMRRSHDLGYYRYAGRRAAPAPVSRRIVAPTGGARTEARSSSDDERHSAAQQRAAAGPRRRGAEQSLARLAAFPATLKAELVEHQGQQRYHLVGHASVVDRPYEMWDAFGPYMEVIERGAFTRTLAAGPDVAFLVNHRGVTMARTTSGSLALSMDDVGLAVEAWLNPKRQDVSDLVEAIKDRDVTEMSFAFMLADGDGSWSEDFRTFRIANLDIDRGDVSAVNYGANPYTDVSARAREVLADLDHLPAGAARAAMARLQLRADLTPVAVPVRAVETGESAGRSLVHVAALLDED